MPIRRPIRTRIGPSTVRSSAIGARGIRDARKQFEAIEYKLARVINKLQGATAEALEYGLEPILHTSLIFVPVDTHLLEASGYIESEQTRNGAVASVGYGMHGNPEYAIFVHEMVDLHHEPPTSAKFLEKAVDAQLDQVLPRIREYMEKNLG